MRATVATVNAIPVHALDSVGSIRLPKRYSKFSAPRLLNTLVRGALFERLNTHVEDRSTIWISAPPGAGKSTLVASFVAHAHISAIWYKVDEGDNDTASFLAFLGKAVRSDGAEAIRMTAALHPDPLANFFHQFYARVPAGSVLVFDDVQNLDWNLAGNILEAAIAAAPPEVCLCFVSRESLPVTLERQRGSRPLVQIGWRALRLDETDSLLLAGIQTSEENEKHRYWLTLTDGWAAGIVILRNHSHEAELGAHPTISQDALDMAFHYFAQEVLGLLTQIEQYLLLMLAHMPDWSREEAEEVTGSDSPGALLERLHGKGLFVDCRKPEGGDVEHFHFHPMFQKFLELESGRLIPASVKATLGSRIAGVFLRRGQVFEAAWRYRDGHDWNALSSLLLKAACHMIAKGEGRSWREWLQWLPEHVKDEAPWLLYWEGYYLNFVDKRQAYLTINRAEAAFTAHGDLRGSLLAVALLIDNIIPGFSKPGYTPLQRCVDAMKSRMAALPAGSLSADDNILIQSRFIAALAFSGSSDGIALRRAVDACVQAIRLAQDDEARLTAATYLIAFAHWYGFHDAESMISLVEPLAGNETVNATIRLWWYFQLARWQLDIRGDPTCALQAIRRATELASIHGLQDVFDFRLKLKRLLLLICTGNLEEARTVMAQMRTAFTPGTEIEEARFRMVEALYHAGSGELALAVRICTEVFRDESRIAPSERPRFAGVLAGFHALAGDFPEAEAWSARAIASSACAELDVWIQSRELLRAYQRLREGNRKGAGAILRRELGRHRASSIPALLPRLPHVASAIAAFALEEDIEAVHVGGIIRRQQLSPSDPANADWPWTVAVQALGPMRIRQRGVLQEAAGKAQQRPLLLLKALLLAGSPGRQTYALAVQLWPDSEDAMTAMNTTVHRLRKLLGTDGAIFVTQGIVTLDASIVWSDLSAFALVLSRIDALSDVAPLSQLLYLQNAVCRLYRGPLFDGDTESWVSGARDRYRNHLVTAASKLGSRLEAMHAWPEANRLYVVAGQADPLVEVIHRGLMRCAHRLEGKASAATAYRQCQQKLSVVLGSKPSIETVALAEALGLEPKLQGSRSNLPVPGAP
ncbi:MAG: hypothetical protein JWR21_1879 [Herminiimonas sp.]|nr:hypothetical protein [Herminiimonas sp.]